MTVGIRRLATAAAVAVLLAACGSADDSTDDAAAETTADTTIDTSTDDDTTAEASGAAARADCPPDEGTDGQTQSFDAPPPMCLDDGATYEAVVTTNKGEVTIALDPEQAPVTTNNFVFLARHRYFDDTVCHRIIPDFVVQCGDPTATGTGGPGYTIVDEPPAPGRYRVGSIAMAKTPAPDSGGSQFFIITGANGTALPPEYSLFGEVTAGLDDTVAAMAAAGTPGAGVPSETIAIESIRIVES